MTHRFYRQPPAIGLAHVAFLLALLIVATTLDWVDAVITKFKHPTS